MTPRCVSSIQGWVCSTLPASATAPNRNMLEKPADVSAGDATVDFAY